PKSTSFCKSFRATTSFGYPTKEGTVTRWPLLAATDVREVPRSMPRYRTPWSFLGEASVDLALMSNGTPEKCEAGKVGLLRLHLLAQLDVRFEDPGHHLALELRVLLVVREPLDRAVDRGDPRIDVLHRDGPAQLVLGHPEGFADLLEPPLEHRGLPLVLLLH